MNAFRKVITAIALVAAAGTASGSAVAKPKCKFGNPGVKVTYRWIHNASGERVGCERTAVRVDDNCDRITTTERVRMSACRNFL